MHEERHSSAINIMWKLIKLKAGVFLNFNFSKIQLSQKKMLYYIPCDDAGFSEAITLIQEGTDFYQNCRSFGKLKVATLKFQNGFTTINTKVRHKIYLYKTYDVPY